MTSQRKQQLQSFLLKNSLPKINLEILDRSLTHKSYINESFNTSKLIDPNLYNQRLEFLGDTLISLVIATYLFNRYPDFMEGVLTKKKSSLICEPTLYDIGKNMLLEDILNMGKGEIETGGLKRSSNIADAVEALLGAYFLDTGFQMAQEVVLQLWKPYLEEDKILTESIDYKSTLQEYFIQNYKIRPLYKTIKVLGPEHSKVYVVELINTKTQQKTIGESVGRKKAEQIAAKKFLALIYKDANNEV